MAMKRSTLAIILLVVMLFVPLPNLIVSAEAREYHHLPLAPNVIGPESIAFDCQGGGPYIGTSDGRVLKWQGPESGWNEFAVTSPYRTRLCDGLHDNPFELLCGRPLGLKFDTNTCDLYITDSSLGLMKVSHNGGVASPVASGAEGQQFKFLNALDIDSESGIVYFTDTSTQFHRWEYYRAMSTPDPTGRLLKYDPRTNAVTVLLRGLLFPNGVALSKHKDFVLVAETMASHIRRYWLTGPYAGTSDIFVQLSGRPDNINRNSHGDFWIAQNPTNPIKVDRHGMLLESLDKHEIVDASDVTEFNGNLWIGSVDQRYLIYTT